MKPMLKALFKVFPIFPVLVLVFFLASPGQTDATVKDYLQIINELSAKAIEPGKPIQVHILIEIKAPEIESKSERPPVAVSLVIDRSGSMSEAKKIAGLGFGHARGAQPMIQKHPESSQGYCVFS